MAKSEESELIRYSKLGTLFEMLSLWKSRFRRSHKCVSSKAVILVLFWSFSVSLINNCVFEGIDYLLITVNTSVRYYSFFYAFESLVLCFYPLAGFLADTKYGRFQMIGRSSQLLLLSIFMGTIFFGIIVTDLYLSIDTFSLMIFFLCLLGVFLFLIFILIMGSLVIFNANIIQFGVDQLQDSPADLQSLFIHWYVWAYYLGFFMTQLGWSGSFGIFMFYNTYNYLMLPIPVAVCTILILIIVVIVHCKKHWFIIDTARPNPYKLVYRVSKFARQHKVPIRRSAFTYCEDDIPSGLDLGKSKYGGPFTTEEVENVKAFYGILKVLFALETALFMNLASNVLLPRFFSHVSSLDNYYYGSIDVTYVLLSLLFKDGFLFSLVIVLFLPFYIVFIRPFINSYKLRIFGQIGVGIVLLLFSVTSTFITDAVAHTGNITHSCMLDDLGDILPTENFIHPAVLLPQQLLYGLSVIFIYPALYEFICAQSPHSMKGLFIGLSFAIRGLFQLLACLLLIPFMFSRFSLPSCGMEYYMMTLVVGVVGLAVYVYVARKYKLRERDEPCHVCRFVEDYYSKIQEEENYDY